MKLLNFVFLWLLLSPLCHASSPKRPARAKRGPGKRKSPQRKGNKVAAKTLSNTNNDVSEEEQVVMKSRKKTSLFSNVLKSNKNKYIAISAVGAAAGVRVFKRIRAKKGSSRGMAEEKATKVDPKVISKLSPATSFASYFSEEGKSPLLSDSASTTPVEDPKGWATEAGKSYTGP